MRDLGEVRVQTHHKGFPESAVGRTVSELRGLRLTGGDFGTPVLLLRQDAWEHNLRTMREFCERAGFSLAPHVKTTMSPQLIAAQFEYGAWAATVATPTQARTLRHLRAPRILLANELVDPAAIAWLGEQLDTDEEFTTYCYVDSSEGIGMLEQALAARGQQRRLPVIVEIGIPRARTGARSAEDALRLAAQVAESKLLRLAGAGGYEGVIDVGLDPGRLGEVETYLLLLRQTANEVRDLAEDDEEFIVTVGGSAFIELVRDVLDASWRGDRALRVVLRSGCYVTHDDGRYEAYRSVMAQRYEPLTFSPALELWARVLSRPEPDRALLDFGRRDVGTDAGYPAVRYVVRRDGSAVLTAPAAEITGLNDQHGYLVCTTPAEPLDLAVGDLVGMGISHPCTTFDKWRVIPVTDSDRCLVGAVETLF